MPARLERFEMPKSLTKDKASATETYAKFIAEPFEAGVWPDRWQLSTPSSFVVSGRSCYYFHSDYDLLHPQRVALHKLGFLIVDRGEQPIPL